MIWGDIWLPGRYDRGELSERFQFEQIVQDFEARRAGRLIYRDRFRWDGPWSPEDANWFFGGALASASLFIAGPVPEALPEADLRSGARSFRSTPAKTASGGAATRRPSRLTSCKQLFAWQLEWTGGPDAPPWLLASSGLAPNHWFSNR